MTASFAERRTIVVADDEEDVRFLLSRLLGDVGFEVHLAQDGLEALERIDAVRPDLLILDLMMPALDGWGVLKRLRTVERPPLVVLLTARGDSESFARGMREGAAAYVTKPFRFHELIATVQALLATDGTPPVLHSERRREPRRPVAADVKVLGRDETPIALGRVVDLSRGGLKVHLGLKIEDGFPVSIAFELPGEPEMGVDGQVRWSHPLPRGYAHGLSFVKLTPETLRQIDALLRKE
jgi:DNA-binding response OmpR family regulator